MFDGFKLENVTWETTGNYIVEAFYTMRQFQFDESDVSYRKDKYIDKKYTFLFSIQVEGVFTIREILIFTHLKHTIGLYLCVGVEVVPSTPQLVRGKPFSLLCRWKEPMFSSVISNEQTVIRADWSWIPQQENGSQSKTLCELKLKTMLAEFYPHIGYHLNMFYREKIQNFIKLHIFNTNSALVFFLEFVYR